MAEWSFQTGTVLSCVKNLSSPLASGVGIIYVMEDSLEYLIWNPNSAVFAFADRNFYLCFRLY
jgi:hypothetical protein